MDIGEEEALLHRLDDIYKELVEIHSQTEGRSTFLNYFVRKTLEEYEKNLMTLHGGEWMPSDLF